MKLLMLAVLTAQADAAERFLYWPLEDTTPRVTSGWEYASGGCHRGIDLVPSGNVNAEVLAAADGTVSVKDDSGWGNHNPYGANPDEVYIEDPMAPRYGNRVEISHPNGLTTVYAHLKAGSIPAAIREGEPISAGTVLGRVNNSGDSTGDHLHFEVRATNSNAKYDPFGVYDGPSLYNPLPGMGDTSSASVVDCKTGEERTPEYLFLHDPPRPAEAIEVDYDVCELEVPLLTVMPPLGEADETEFIFTSIVDDMYQPETVTLWIYSPVTDSDWPHEMVTFSEESPWVYTHRKTLGESLTYPYWIEVIDSEECVELTPEEYVTPTESTLGWIRVVDAGVVPEEGIAGETPFEFHVDVQTSMVEEAEIVLYIVNAEDALVHPFEVVDTSWYEQRATSGVYIKENMRDEAVYSYWFVVSAGGETQTSEVMTIVVTNDDGTGGGEEDIDLSAGRVAISDNSPTAGDQVDVSGGIDNLGTDWSGSFSIGIYLSADGAFDTWDTLLALWSENSLGGGSSISYSERVTIPSSASGGYSVLVVVDPSDEISEPDETNNIGASSISVTSVSTTIDLDPGSVTVSDNSPTAGDQVDVSGSIANTGTSSSGVFSVGVYLSTDSTYDTWDTLLASWSESSIGAGGSASYSERVTVPSSASGSYSVLVEVDPSNMISESDETNNTGARAISVSSVPTTIDLDPGSVTVSDTSPTAGDQVDVFGSIANAGTGSSGAFSVGVYLSTDSTYDTSDTLLASWSESSIGAGGSASYSERVTVPSSASGSYSVLVEVDPSNVISESDETNNTGARAISVASVPTTIDLDPGSVTVSDTSPTAGDQVDVSGSIANAGTGSSGAFSVGVYLSTDSIYDTSDTLLASWSESSIGAGGSASYSERVTVPSSASGSYSVLVEVDPSNVISESDETNNTAARAVAVTAACTATDYWSPSSMSNSDTDAVYGETLTAEWQDDGLGGIEFRVCKTSGTFSYDIHVEYYEQVYSWSSLQFDQDVTTSGNLCSSWQSLNLSSRIEGDGFGGDLKVVSPEYCDTYWGSGASCSSSGSCGSCWLISSGIMTRTCL